MEFVNEALNHSDMKTTKGYFAGFADDDAQLALIHNAAVVAGRRDDRLFMRQVATGCFDEIQRLGGDAEVLLRRLGVVVVPQADELAGGAGQSNRDVCQSEHFASRMRVVKHITRVDLNAVTQQ